MTREWAIKRLVIALDAAEEEHKYFPIDPIHAAAVVTEEAGELTRAALQWAYEGNPQGRCIEEAAHTGAMALRFLMACEHMKTNRSNQVPTSLPPAIDRTEGAETIVLRERMRIVRRLAGEHDWSTLSQRLAEWP